MQVPPLQGPSTVPLATHGAAIQHTNENGDSLQFEGDSDSSNMDGVQFFDGDYYDVPLDDADTIIQQDLTTYLTMEDFVDIQDEEPNEGEASINEDQLIELIFDQAEVLDEGEKVLQDFEKGLEDEIAREIYSTQPGMPSCSI